MSSRRPDVWNDGADTHFVSEGKLFLVAIRNRAFRFPPTASDRHDTTPVASTSFGTTSNRCGIGQEMIFRQTGSTALADEEIPRIEPETSLDQSLA